MLYFSNPQIVFQELPDEISLAFSISGCPLQCESCHSSYTWKTDFGTPLTSNILKEQIKTYSGLISCVIFYGGEWDLECLEVLIEIIKTNDLKCCLYTGQELNYFNQNFLKKLDFIKTGRFISSLGGVDSPSSNQILFQIANDHFTNITHKMRRHT